MGAYDDWMMTQQAQQAQAPVGTNTVLAPTPDDSQPPDPSGRVLGVKSYLADKLKSLLDGAMGPSQDSTAVAPLTAVSKILGKIGNSTSTPQPDSSQGASPELTQFLLQSQFQQPASTAGANSVLAPASQSAPSQQAAAPDSSQLQPVQPSAPPAPAYSASAPQQQGPQLSGVKARLQNMLYNFGQGYAHQFGMSDQDKAARQAQIDDTQARTGLLRSESEQVPVQVGGETIMLPKKVAAGPLGKYITAVNKTGTAPKPVFSNNGVPVAIEAGGNTYAIGDPNMPKALTPLAQGMVNSHQQRLQDEQNKPDTAVQNKQRFQDAIAQVTAESGNRLDPGIVTDPRKMASSISSSKSLTDEQKRFALSYIAANPTPASQALNVVLRGESYGSSKIYQQYDTKMKMTRPVSADEINRANTEEPGRYTSPAYDPTSIMERSVAKDLATGKTKDQIVSFNALLGHIGDLNDGIDQLRNSGSPLINKPINWLKANAAGDPAVSNFIQRMEPVKKEYESFLLNNRALYDDDRKAADKIINESMSPAQMQENMKGFAHTASVRLGAANDSYKRAKGGKDIPDLLTDEADSTLRTLGVSVPGYKVARTQPNTPPPDTRVQIGATASRQDGTKWRFKGGDSKNAANWEQVK